MKASQFSDEQIVQIVQHAERDDPTIGAVCRAHGIALTPCYRWRKKFGGMTVADADVETSDVLPEAFGTPCSSLPKSPSLSEPL